MKLGDKLTLRALKSTFNEHVLIIRILSVDGRRDVYISRLSHA